jgi:hypothetical protein
MDGMKDIIKFKVEYFTGVQQMQPFLTVYFAFIPSHSQKHQRLPNLLRLTVINHTVQSLSVATADEKDTQMVSQVSV